MEPIGHTPSQPRPAPKDDANRRPREIEQAPGQQATMQLAHAHALLRDTQKAAGIGSHVYHVGTGHAEWSEELYRILGVEPGTTVTPELAMTIVHPDDAQKLFGWGERVVRGEVLPPVLVRFIRPGGAVRYVEVRASCVHHPSGPILQGVGLDVSARVEMEERLRHAVKMEAVGTLAAGIAHDFNNYLAVLSMHLDLIKMGASAELEATVQGARHAADQCAKFTRQLLTFARKQPAAPRQIDAIALVREAGRLIENLLGTSVTVSLDLSAEPLFTHADPGQLESALVNLAANARDAMPGGGWLRLQATRAVLTPLDAHLERDCPPGNYVLIRVTDTGAGIAPEHLPRIFEPYFSTKPVGQGTGLGLATVYGTVRQHQGFMRVESTLDRGTTFEVYLPEIERHATPSPLAPRADARHPTLSGRVLVVEDMAPLRELAVAVIETLGVQVVAAADGLMGLDLAKTADPPFDLVVSDLKMPRMTGEELASAVAGLWPATRFVFMTGYLDQTVQDRLISQHAGCRVLNKPFRSAELSEAVSALLAVRGESSPSSAHTQTHHFQAAGSTARP